MAASAGGDGRERKPLVSIVIVAGSGDRLPRAIESACRQSWVPTETVVVHDGTSAAIAAAIERYPGVRSVVHRDCGGRGAARNAGLGAIGGDYVAFIGGDDLLFPAAAAAGVAQLEADSAAALAVGAIQDADGAGNPLGKPILPDRPDEPYIALLHRDYIGDCAAVLFRRAALEQVGGFAAERSLGADWDLYLRLAYRFPLTHHPTAVSAHRPPVPETSRQAILAMTEAWAVLETQQRLVRLQGRRLAAQQAGLRASRRCGGARVLRAAASELVRPPSFRDGITGIGFVVRQAPGCIVVEPARALWRAARRAGGAAWARLPRPVRAWIETRRAGWRLRPPRGFVRFGSLRRLTPISRDYGFERGRPVDRVYIERFLQRHADDVRERVLEFGDDLYTRRFGGDRVSRSDIVEVDAAVDNPSLSGNLGSVEHLPEDSFDCVVATQVFQYIYDLRGMIAHLHRVLKPGGVVLTTMPGLTHLHGNEWPWFWLLTPASAARLFKEHFAVENLEVETHGNVHIAVAFLHGVAAEELAAADFDYTDPDYPVVITVRAVKEAPNGSE